MANWSALSGIGDANIDPTMNATDPAGVLLFARPKLTMGKLREAPVDLCLRYYPVATFKDALQRISRNHLCLRYDAVENRCVVDDQGSPVSGATG